MTGADLPLAGRRVLVTRTRLQAEGLVDRLHALGASVVVVPLIATVPIASPDQIVQVAGAIRASAKTQWVAFTSATAVRLVLGGAGADVLAGTHVAAVGPATAAALEAAGNPPELVAGDHDAAGLAKAMLERGMSNACVWFPSAWGSSGVLVTALRAAGASVTVQHIYRSAMPDQAPERLHAALAGGIDAITLTSGSTARNLVAALGGDPLPRGVQVVCIGEPTAHEARAAGVPVHAVASDASMEGLVDAVAGRLAPQPLG